MAEESSQYPHIWANSSPLPVRKEQLGPGRGACGSTRMMLIPVATDTSDTCEKNDGVMLSSAASLLLSVTELIKFTPWRIQVSSSIIKASFGHQGLKLVCSCFCLPLTLTQRLFSLLCMNSVFGVTMRKVNQQMCSALSLSLRLFWTKMFHVALSFPLKCKTWDCPKFALTISQSTFKVFYKDTKKMFTLTILTNSSRLWIPQNYPVTSQYSELLCVVGDFDVFGVKYQVVQNGGVQHHIVFIPALDKMTKHMTLYTPRHVLPKISTYDTTFLLHSRFMLFSTELSLRNTNEFFTVPHNNFFYPRIKSIHLCWLILNAIYLQSSTSVKISKTIQINSSFQFFVLS